MAKFKITAAEKDLIEKRRITAAKFPPSIAKKIKKAKSGVKKQQGLVKKAEKEVAKYTKSVKKGKEILAQAKARVNVHKKMLADHTRAVKKFEKEGKAALKKAKKK